MKDPACIFGSWRGFESWGAWQQSGPSAMRTRGGSIADFRAAGAHQKAHSPQNDDHYEEIVRGLGNGALRLRVTPMSDRELSKAIAEFLNAAPSAEGLSNLGRPSDPSSSSA
jgi:hypothetical protein